jgi:hypothetical protein
MEQKLFKHFGKNTSWYFPSIKNFGNRMRSESRFELSAMYYLEFDESILKYQAQPKSFVYTSGGKRRRYTPDFLIHSKIDGYQFIELKPKKFAQKEEFLEKHGVLNDYFLNRFNIPLKVWTEDTFYDEILINNYRRFYSYKAYDFSRYCLKKALDALRGCEVVSDLYDICKRFNATDAFAPALLANRIIQTDFYSEFSADNKIEVMYND